MKSKGRAIFVNNRIKYGKGFRVVIVANEEEIESKSDEESSKSYARTKLLE